MVFHLVIISMSDETYDRKLNRPLLTALLPDYEVHQTLVEYKRVMVFLLIPSIVLSIILSIILTIIINLVF